MSSIFGRSKPKTEKPKVIPREANIKAEEKAPDLEVERRRRANLASNLLFGGNEDTGALVKKAKLG